MSDNRYIGVFDSGIGGMTVVKSIVESMPGENIIYFGDTAHVPYGTRSERQITEYVLADVRFLRTFDIKAVVIACNTADAVAKQKVRDANPDLPVFGVVDPASRLAAETSPGGKIGVIATKATVNSGAYEAAIAKYDPKAQVFQQACPLLVPLVENGRFRKGDPVIEIVLREYLDPLVEEGIDTLVLGCTHYPLLSSTIKALYPQLNVISSSDAAAAKMLGTLIRENACNENTEAADSERKYFVSDDAEGVDKLARVFMGDELGGTFRQVDVE
ncbi:MAG: glutamate racemase [Clostridia bacterium]|nr:glutamate racemase [Clostridia bacterium]MBP5273285.1 glutamate racemase [Clostridia bacterium]MBP5460342.1 glutamate racemase [Clostridia bacterium]